jgi:arylsulfatase A-like enzyme
MKSTSRRIFLQSLSTAGIGLAQKPSPKPNILYILADDLGWGDLRCYNPQSAVPTPNADRLAAQGVRFTDMHSPSSVCTPTRYGILTGRYCWRTTLKKGVLNGHSPNLIEEGRLTVPAMLKRQGYYTAGVGKWHLGLGSQPKTDFRQPLRPCPTDHGFDYYYGIPASLDMDPYVYFENDRTVEQATSTIAESKTPRGVFWRGGAIAPQFKIPEVLPTLTAKTISILKDRARKPEQPFFLYFPLTAPHTPWVPQEPYQGRSKAGLYGDFVAQVDDMLGRVFATLEETGLAKNTLVIFTSDNGADWKIEDKAKFAHRANADWRGEKADIWDGGHRIPFLARWPGRIAAGSVSKQLGCLTDLMATAAAISGFTLPSGTAEDSYNLLPALTGKPSKPIRSSIVHHSIDGMFSIREGDWKLELGLGSGGFTPPARIPANADGPQGQLYNLAKDPAEADNLWQKHPEVVKRLTAQLERIQQQGFSRPM